MCHRGPQVHGPCRERAWGHAHCVGRVQSEGHWGPFLPTVPATSSSRSPSTCRCPVSGEPDSSVPSDLPPLRAAPSSRPTEPRGLSTLSSENRNVSSWWPPRPPVWLPPCFLHVPTICCVFRNQHSAEAWRKQCHQANHPRPRVPSGPEGGPGPPHGDLQPERGTTSAEQRLAATGDLQARPSLRCADGSNCLSCRRRGARPCSPGRESPRAPGAAAGRGRQPASSSGRRPPRSGTPPAARTA